MKNRFYKSVSNHLQRKRIKRKETFVEEKFVDVVDIPVYCGYGMTGEPISPPRSTLQKKYGIGFYDYEVLGVEETIYSGSIDCYVKAKLKITLRKPLP